MKNIKKIVNILLVSMCCVVAAIFIFGFLKPTDNSKEQTSTFSSMSEKPVVQSLSQQDELTNKYMKELQNKLKKDELESAKEFQRAQNIKRTQKIKDDDWTKVPIEQQISRENQYDDLNRSTAGARSPGIHLNKDNAAEFVETARKNGYHVILSETYEVISITPIMNTRNINDSFDTNPAQ